MTTAKNRFSTLAATSTATGDLLHALRVALAVAPADHRRGGDGEPVCDDGAERRKLVADADGSERRPGDARVEVTDEVRVHEIERRLQPHPERDRRAEARHL